MSNNLPQKPVFDVKILSKTEKADIVRKLVIDQMLAIKENILWHKRNLNAGSNMTDYHKTCIRAAKQRYFELKQIADDLKR